MGDEIPATREGRLDMWEKEWEAGHWNMVYTQPGTVLSKHYERLAEGREGLKILLPMSATTYDLIWLHDKGHVVVGTDLAESAAQRIFKQMKQEPIIEDVPSINGKLYKNSTGTLKYYVGDFFKFTKDLEGRFDVILDSKAMCSCDERDWDSYLKVLKEVMAPKCRLMIEFFRRTKDDDKSTFPYCFTKEQLQGFYGELCDIEYLDEGVFDTNKIVIGDFDAKGNVIPTKKVERDTEVLEGDVIPTDAYLLKKWE